MVYFKEHCTFERKALFLSIRAVCELKAMRERWELFIKALTEREITNHAQHLSI